jgi:UDP-4-amino-4,6-dideoxy-N-acetyl-beta-L-altrosamine transaminase
LTTSRANALDIPYARQRVEEDDVAAVEAALRSDWLTSGPALTAFEEQVAAYCGAQYGAAVSSGTAALHATCHALGIGAGDRVWTSPISFVASANCALYCDATVDFVDIDPRSYNICPTELQNKLTDAAQRNALPKALIAVHFGGRPCDLRELAALTRPYHIAIVEDATHALGATYRGERIGSCRYSEAAVFSFHPIKSITAGEGGMVVTNRENVLQSVRRFRNHGITPNTSTAEPWRYEQRELGFNYRMTDLQAALGTSQLGKLDRFITRRAELAKRYDEGLADLPLQLPARDDAGTSAWHLYPIQIVAGDRPGMRRKLYGELLRHGIHSQVHYIPIHTQPFYRDLGFRTGQFPAAEHYYDGALSLPLFVDLTESEQDRVIEIVRATLTER